MVIKDIVKVPISRKLNNKLNALKKELFMRNKDALIKMLYEKYKEVKSE